MKDDKPTVSNNENAKRKKTGLQRLATKQRWSSPQSPPKFTGKRSQSRDKNERASRIDSEKILKYTMNDPYSEFDPNDEEKVERHFKHLLRKRFAESDALQVFFQNGLFKPVLIPSEDYRPEYRHFFGLKAYAIPQSVLVTTSALGILMAFGAGPLWLPVPILAGVATSHHHVFDPDVSMTKFVTAPMIEGQSVISDEYCPPICRDYQKLPPDYKPKSRFMQSIQAFKENCYRRKVWETLMRRDQGLEKDAPVSIPPGGVPPSTPTNLDILGVDDAKDQGLANHAPAATLTTRTGRLIESGKSRNVDFNVELLVLDQEQFEKYARKILSQNMYSKK